MGRSYLADPMLKFNYEVTVIGDGSSVTIGASKISGLKSKVNIIDYQEGGDFGVHKVPGRVDYEPLTIERGMYCKGYTDSAGAAYDEVAKRHYDMLSVIKTGAGADTATRFTVIIKLKDTTKKTAHKWVLSECWFPEWNMDDLEGKSDDIAIEKVTMVFEDMQHETP